MKKHNGFTLIELVIVVAIIGILALMIIPQFNQVTKDAKEKTFTANCRTVVSAWAMYQAGNKGASPKTSAALSSYINGGWPKDGDPDGSTYKLVDGVFTGTMSGMSTFTYPE